MAPRPDRSRHRVKRAVAFAIFVPVASLLVAEVLAPLLLSAISGYPPDRHSFRSLLLAQGSQLSPADTRVDRTVPSFMADHVLHPFLGFVRNHDLEQQIFNGRIVEEPVNDYGYFGPSLLTADSSSYVVVLTGGSVAAELFLYGRDTLLREIEAKLPGRRIELFSIALGGLKQPQQLLAINWFLTLGAKIDLVINLDGFNEAALPMADNAAAGVYPWFPRSWRFYAAQGLDIEATALVGESLVLRRQRQQKRERLSRSPLRHSYLFLVAFDLRLQRGQERLVELDRQLRSRLGGTLTFRERGPAYSTRRQDIIETSTQVWKRASLSLWRLCSASGVAYVHLLQPNQNIPGSKPLTAGETRSALLPPGHAYLRGLAETYSQLRVAGMELGDAGVAFFDLTDAFQNEERTLYRDRCCHFNDLGNRLLAEAVGKSAAQTLQSAPARISR